jgi:hypothetical protein
LWPHMPRRPSRFPDAGHGLCLALVFVPPVVRNGENDDSFWGLWHFGNAESWFGEIWKTAHRLTGHSPQSQFPFKQPSNLNDHWSPFSVTIFILAPYSWSILIMKSQLQWRLTHQNSPAEVHESPPRRGCGGGSCLCGPLQGHLVVTWATMLLCPFSDEFVGNLPNK